MVKGEHIAILSKFIGLPFVIKIWLSDQLALNAGQKYCRMLQGILQYFGPSLSYHLSLRSLFCLFLSGHFTQVLLYANLYLMLDSGSPMVSCIDENVP